MYPWAGALGEENLLTYAVVAARVGAELAGRSLELRGAIGEHKKLCWHINICFGVIPFTYTLRNLATHYKAHAFLFLLISTSTSVSLRKPLAVFIFVTNANSVRTGFVESFLATDGNKVLPSIRPSLQFMRMVDAMHSRDGGCG